MLDPDGELKYKPWNSGKHVSNSSLFENPSRVKRRIGSKYKPWDSEIIKGEDDSEAWNRKREPLKEFKPKFNEQPAYERKQNEFYGTPGPKKVRRVRDEPTSLKKVSAKEKHYQEFSSSLFDKTPGTFKPN